MNISTPRRADEQKPSRSTCAKGPAAGAVVRTYRQCMCGEDDSEVSDASDEEEGSGLLSFLPLAGA